MPDDFRFLVKAPEILTVARFPKHPRYPQGGEVNPDFLSGQLARSFLQPVLEGFGEKLGCVLLQFPHQSPIEMGGAMGFAARLHDFLEGLPRAAYAVELRNPPLFTSSYVAAPDRLGVSHCHNIHPSMPELAAQAQETCGMQGLRLVRWMLGRAPTRAALARLIGDWLQSGHKVLVIVNNKAEGSAPLTLRKLCEAL